MKTKNNNNETILIVGLVVVAAGVGIYMYNKNKKETSDSGDSDSDPAELPEQTPINPSTPGNSTPVVTKPLNNDLILKLGSKGAEVVALQRLLGGITADGVFGAKTESALYARKAVKQISLNGFKAKADVNTNALAIGNRVMAAKNNVNTYLDHVLADGQHSNTHELEDTYSFGDAIGKIIAITKDKNSYIVKDEDTFSNVVWVLAADVSKI